MPAKTRKCKHCKTRVEVSKGFSPPSTLSFYCSTDCCAAHTAKKQQEAKQKEHRRSKKEFDDGDIGLQKKLAQKAFNEFIRIRDEGEGCISCSKADNALYGYGAKPKQFHAGHYRSVGACPQLRFEEDNCYLQCQTCNTHKSGNIIEYRKALVKKIGVDRVEWLEGDHPPKKYKLADYVEIKELYRAKVRELKKERK